MSNASMIFFAIVQLILTCCWLRVAQRYNKNDNFDPVFVFEVFMTVPIVFFCGSNSGLSRFKRCGARISYHRADYICCYPITHYSCRRKWLHICWILNKALPMVVWSNFTFDVCVRVCVCVETKQIFNKIERAYRLNGWSVSEWQA